MTDLEKIISDIRQLNHQQMAQLQQELILLRAGIDATEPQSCRELAPIDVPVEHLKNPETGALQIRYHFAIGLRSTLGWIEIEVTPAAQSVLAQIFSESITADEKAGRTPPKPSTIQ